MKKIGKRIMVLIMVLAISYFCTIGAEAASVKNPTVKGGKGIVEIGLWSGDFSGEAIHTAKSVKIDGKEMVKKVKYPENVSGENYHYIATVSTAKGSHKVEVKDNKGYWVTGWVTVR